MIINPFKIVWTTLIEDVVYILPSSPDFKQKYTIQVKSLDINEPGAELSEKMVGYYVKDFIGSIFRITAVNVDSNPNKIEVEDEELKNAGPQIGQYGWVYESIGDGTSRGIAPIRHKRIDESALDYTRAIELELLWRLRFTTSGVYIQPTITRNLDGTITIGDDGEYVLFSNTYTNPPEKYSISGGTFTPIDQANNYLIVEYNGGEPRLNLVSSRDSINQMDVIPIYTIYRNGAKLILLDWDKFSVGLANKLNDRLVRTQRFVAEDGSLILLGEANLTLGISDGYVWGGASRWYLPEYHSATNGIVFYRHVAGVWTESDQTTYNNSQYDDGTDLQPLLPNRYSVNYIYRRVGSTNYKAYFTLGRGDYTLNEAQNALPPSPPPEIQSTGILVGRIIIENGALLPTSVESAFQSTFGYVPVGVGSVVSVSVVTTNGFSGTVDLGNPSIPAITLSTTITSGSMIKSSSNALVAATLGTDYSGGTSGLTTGILKSTTGTGVLSIAVASDFPILNQNTTGNAATASKLYAPVTINGVSFDGSVGITIPFTETDPIFTSWRDASRTAKYVWVAPNSSAGSPTWRQLSFTDISGTITVDQGGIGTTSLTGIVIGNGTSAMSALVLPAGYSIRRNTGDTAYESYLPQFYTHPSYTPITAQNLSGANVFKSIVVDSGGHVTSVTTRALTLSDLGFSGSNTADYYGYWVLGANSNATQYNITSGVYATFNAGVGISISQVNNVLTITNTGSGVTSVSAGNGMNFTTITGIGSITLGTPSTLTPSTTNSVTSTSHTHAVTGLIADGTSVGQMIYWNGTAWTASDVTKLAYDESIDRISFAGAGSFSSYISGGTTGSLLYGIALSRSSVSGGSLWRPDVSGVSKKLFIGRGGYITDIIVGDGTGPDVDGVGTANAYIRFTNYTAGVLKTDATGVISALATVAYGVRFLREDGTWQSVGGGTGTVTQVGTSSSATGLTLTGGPITGVGTVTLGLTAGYAIPTTTNISHAESAYSWGNHALAGYLTSYNESDPVFSSWSSISRTSKYVFAAPTAAAGVPSWRQLSYTDISGTAPHPSYTPIAAQNLSGANVFKSIVVDNIGSVTSIVTRVMTLTDLGFYGSTVADYYNHWLLGTNNNSTLQQVTSSGYACFNAGAGISISQSGTVITITNTGGGGSGVTSVSAGNGMNFTTITTTGAVTLGTPSSCSDSSTNAVTSTSHTHAVTGFLPLSGGSLTGAVTSTNTYTGLNFILNSDRRLKTNICDINLSHMDIKYKEFEVINFLGEKRYGVLAQDLLIDYPELVSGNDVGGYSVKYIDLLVREVAYLKEEVRKLKDKN